MEDLGLYVLEEEWKQEIHEIFTELNATRVLSPALIAFASRAGCIAGF